MPPGDSWQRLEALVTPGEGGGSCIHWGRPRVLANFPRSTGTHAAGPRGGSHVQTGRAEVGAREETAQGRSGCFLVALGRAAPSSTPPLFQPPTEHRASCATLSKDAAQWPTWRLKAGSPTAHLKITRTFQKSLQYYSFGSSLSSSGVQFRVVWKNAGKSGKRGMGGPWESLSLDSANTVAAGALREGTLLSGGDSHSCLARKHACQQNDSAVLFQLNPLGLQLLPQRLGTGKSKQCS